MILITRCCLCKKLENDQGEYVDADQFTFPEEYEFSDTFCRPCFRIKYPDYAHIVAEPVEV